MLQCVTQVKRITHGRALLKPNRTLKTVKRSCSTGAKERIVFGIDYGSNLAKLAVYDRVVARPRVLLNPDDGNVPYWHTAVAYDKSSEKLVTGKRAKEIARKDAGAAVIKVKKLLGTTPGHRHYDEWISENKPKRIAVQDADAWSEEEKKVLDGLLAPNKVVVTLESFPDKTFTAVELASTTFESMRHVMAEYQAKHGGDPNSLPEAYLVVPPDFDETQRSAVVLAARRAGIQVIKLLEEPIAALYGVRRLENFGWYSITDFGDTLKQYVVRVFDGEPDLYEASYVELPEILPLAERAFYRHLVSKLPATKHVRPWKDEMVKLFDASKDYLIDEPEYIVPNRWMKRTLPYISREARALSTSYSLRTSKLEEKLAKAVTTAVPMKSVTHPVLIGGHSLAYPDVANILERAFGTRLSDTVSDPTTAMVVGAAMKASEDLGLTNSILRGRDASALGHPIISSNYSDSMHHHLHLSKHHVPLPSTLNFSTLAAWSKTEPLLPAFQEEHLLPANQLVPYPALSYAHIRDPFSGELEHWARVSIQVPKPAPQLDPTPIETAIGMRDPIPYDLVMIEPLPDWITLELSLMDEPTTEDVQPDLSLCFVLNLTASPLFDTSRNVTIRTPDADKDEIPRLTTHHTDHPAFAKLLKENPDHPEWQHQLTRDVTPRLAETYQENLMDILETIQAQKDSHSGYYRIQNRAHDLVQSIISKLRPHDHHSVIATGGAAPTPLAVPQPPEKQQPRMGSATRVSPFVRQQDADNMSVMDAIISADCTGRAGSKYVDAITMAHEMFVEHQEKLKTEYERDLKDDLADLRRAIEKFNGPTGQRKPLPLVVYTDDASDLPQPYGGWENAEDPSEWHWPGITPRLLHDYYVAFKLLEYQLTEAGAKDIDKAISDVPAEERVDTAKIQQRAMALTRDWDHLNEEETSERRNETFAEVRFLSDLIKRMDARKKLKKIYGHQHRIVMITDSQPDANQLKEIENAMTRAARDNVAVTFLSIDGTPFDGPFLQMVSRVKGAKVMRLYKQYLWNTEFQNKFGIEQPNAWHKELTDDPVRNLAVKMDFPGYTIDKVYGGWMTPEEKARLEMQSSTSTIRLKIGSLAPSYDIIPGPTPPAADPTAMLVKLKPKPGANDEMRATHPDWFYDPASTTTSKALAPAARAKPSAHTPVTVDITWNDGVGGKHNRIHTLRLSDFNAPAGYSDEPGIARLVRNAKFVELMRKVLHAPFQSRLSTLESDTPIFSMDTEHTGITFIGQKMENELVRIYDESKQSVIRIANERLLDGNPDGPIPKEYHGLLSVSAHLMDLQNIRHHIHGEFEHSTDIVHRLFASYMKASNIKPVSLYARWMSTMQTMREASQLVRLEDPNLRIIPSSSSEEVPPAYTGLITGKPVEKEIKSITLATWTDSTKLLPAPQLVRTPKFHGLLSQPHELNPSLDRRNSYINSQRMNALELFPRDIQRPVAVQDLMIVNTLLDGSRQSFDMMYTYVDPAHMDEESAFAVPLGFPKLREYVKERVGTKNWPTYERQLDEIDEMQMRFQRNMNTPGLAGLRADFNLTYLSRIEDDQLWIDLVNLAAHREERKVATYERNAILGPRLKPLSELREYYMHHIAPHMSPDEIERGLKMFARLEKRNAKSEAKFKVEADLYDMWYGKLQQERAYPSNWVSHAKHLLEKVRQEDLEQSAKNQAMEQLDSLEQQAIDSNSVLMKYLVENPDVLNNIASSSSSEEPTQPKSDQDILDELRKHLPAGFLEKHLSTVERVRVTAPGIDPELVEDVRMLGSEDKAWYEDQQMINIDGKVDEMEASKSLLNHLYRRLNPFPKYRRAHESSTSGLPLEVELGNIPIDWDERHERLKRKARAVVRQRVVREMEEKSEMRSRLRKEFTRIAQHRVDHRLFLMNLSRQEQELELANSELPYVDPEEYQRRLDRLKIHFNSDEYTVLVWTEYRRVSEALMDSYEHQLTRGARALIPFMPEYTEQMVNLLERKKWITRSTAQRYKDPIGYWYPEDYPVGQDFMNIKVTTTGKSFTFEEFLKRSAYEEQVATAQAKEAASSSSSDVLVEPDHDGGMTVSSHEPFASTAADEHVDPSEATPSSEASVDAATETHDAAQTSATATDASTEPPTTPPSQSSSNMDMDKETISESVPGESPPTPEPTPWTDGTQGEMTPEDVLITPPPGESPDVVELTEEIEEIEEEPAEPRKIVYTEWDSIADPWESHDFRTDLDYHIYRHQNMVTAFPRDPEVLAEKRNEVSFSLNDFLTPEGVLDWNLVKERRHQYPVTPDTPDLIVDINTTFDMTNSTGEDIEIDDLDEREVTKAEVEATASLDVDTVEGVVQSMTVMEAMRLRLAEDLRAKKAVEKREKRFAPYSLDTEDGPSYDPLREGWDQQRWEEMSARAYALFTEKSVELDGEEARLRKRWNRKVQEQRIASQIEYTMIMPGVDEKNYAEEWVQEHQIARELRYSPVISYADAAEPRAWDALLANDRLAAKGGDLLGWDWLYLKLFGLQIPIGIVFEQETPLHLPPPSFHRLKLNPLTPMEMFQARGESLFMTKTMPAPLAPAYKDPKIKKEEKVLDDLKRFPIDRYLMQTRKAYEKYYGLARSTSRWHKWYQDKLDSDEAAEFKSSTGFTSLSSIRRLVQPATTSVSHLNLETDEERNAEALRIVKLGMDKLGLAANKPSTDSDPSSAPTLNATAASSSTPTPNHDENKIVEQKPIQDSLESLRGTKPGILSTPAPQTLRERWEYAKRMMMDRMMRNYYLQYEKENYESWIEVQKKNLRSRDLDSSPPIVKYPEYGPLTERNGFFGIPGVSVSKILQQMTRERKERGKRAREVLRAELRKAYRDLTADQARTQSALEELFEEYEDTVRRRLRRHIVVDLPDNVEEMLDPMWQVGEQMHSEIQHPIDRDLFNQVREDMKVPGADPEFWRLKDTRSKQAQKKISKLLTSGTKAQAERWEKKMDEIHERRVKLSQQVQARSEELLNKRLKMEIRALYGPVILHDLEQTSIFDKDPAATHHIKGLESLDERARDPSRDWDIPFVDHRHVHDLAFTSYSSSFMRLADHVQDALRKQRAEAGLPEEEVEEDSHGHGHH